MDIIYLTTGLFILTFYAYRKYKQIKTQNELQIIDDHQTFEIHPTAMRRNELIKYLQKDDVPSKLKKIAEERFNKYFKRH